MQFETRMRLRLEHKYLNEVAFHSFVDAFEKNMTEGHVTYTDIREALDFAREKMIEKERVER